MFSKKINLDACIYKPQLVAIAGADNHIGLAGLTIEQKQAKLWKILKIFKQGEKNIKGPRFSLMLTCKTSWRSRQQLDEKRRRIRKFYNYCPQSAAH